MPFPSSSRATLPFALASLVLIAGSTARPGQPPVPVSTSTASCLTGAGGSFLPTLSADGRLVAFLSHANNLVTNDNKAPWLDCFVHDLESSTTLLASPDLTGAGGADADVTDVVLAANGRWVAFTSAAGNLVSGDTNQAADVFVRDLQAGHTLLVSRGPGGISPVNPTPDFNAPLSARPQISSNGHWIAFESRATNLVPLLDTNGQTDVFVRDLLGGRTHLVSIAAFGSATGSGSSHSARLSPKGRHVAFVSCASDLVPGVTNQWDEVFLHDLETGQTVWVSTNAARHAPAGAAYACFHPAISANGQSVVYKMTAAGQPTVRVLHHDLPTGTTLLVTDNSRPESWPQITPDGGLVACEDAANIVVWDRASALPELVSATADGTGLTNAVAHTPVLSSDGSKIAFVSPATNILPDVTNGAAQIYLRDRHTQITTLITRGINEQPGTGRMGTVMPALSADGRRIAFSSPDDGLIDDDCNRESDAFMRDLASGELLLVSARAASAPAMTGVALSEAAHAISADGNRIGFISLDGSLAPGDTNGWQDAFVWERPSGQIVPVSVRSNQTFATDLLYARRLTLSADGSAAAFHWDINYHYRWEPFGPRAAGNIYWRDLTSPTLLLANLTRNGNPIPNQCVAPMISPDGRVVAYRTTGPVSGIIPGGLGGDASSTNVFLRDMIAGTNGLVSADQSGSGLTGYHALNLGFSPNGQYLLFSSRAPTLTEDEVGPGQHLFARDLVEGFTLLVSRGPAGNTSWGYLEGACWSGDSRHVAWVAPAGLTLRHLGEPAGTVVTTNGRAPSLDATGRFLAYETSADNGTSNIAVFDLVNGESELITRALDGGGGNADSFTPLISADGRYVVYASRADNLVPNDLNRATDVFIRDRLLNVTLLASANHHGTGSGNGPSDRPLIAANGRTVVFQSFANDLVPGDYNFRRDVFVLDLGGRDSDGDGLDDDWELAYFETLTRNGTGDFDGDSATDAAEFHAGTDPTNSGSVLRVLTLTSPGTSGATVLWTAVPGRTYRVQYRDGLTDATGWMLLAGPVTVSGTTGAVRDPDGGTHPHRFYRVVLDTNH